MKKFFTWQIALALILISLSVIFYFIHYLIFRDAHHIFLYLISDIAFLFLDTMIVVFVLNRLLIYREKEFIAKKLNMIIGAFFSEVGYELLKQFCQSDTNRSAIDKQLLVSNSWTDKDFIKTSKMVVKYESIIDIRGINLINLKDFLVNKRSFLLGLLDNPNLLEQEAFSDLLWAVFHLTDELSHRTSFKGLPEADYQHLSYDIKRVYGQLIVQWLGLMKHLKRDYPYLFSLAIRLNPFDINACVEIKG